MVVGAFLGALVGVLVLPFLYQEIWHAIDSFLSRLQKVPGEEIAVAIAGLIVGLLVALLASLPLSLIPWIGRYLPLIVTLVGGYLGAALAVRKKDELLRLAPWRSRRPGREADQFAALAGSAPGKGPVDNLPAVAATVDSEGRASSDRSLPQVTRKLLDTSAIIDGRIADVAAAGFLEGPLVIPGFVIQELQRLADSPEELKRNRGRRGLDLLNRMRQDPSLQVEIWEENDTAGQVVDLALVKLARKLGAKVVTNDYNLHKVAQLHGVAVLNLNELANATRPVVLPGEELEVRVLRDGKEQGQGVGYLDDGTMIVVDGGRPYIGSTVAVTVTSVLQTSAGRMIFARPKTREQAVGVRALSG
ncbi:MAG: TRAM domain-containing protein [Limnochordales bacterium]|nr:TRAM domain-containing protein [Limnochordales bacterium]